MGLGVFMGPISTDLQILLSLPNHLNDQDQYPKDVKDKDLSMDSVPMSPPISPPLLDDLDDKDSISMGPWVLPSFPNDSADDISSSPIVQIPLKQALPLLCMDWMTAHQPSLLFCPHSRLTLMRTCNWPVCQDLSPTDYILFQEIQMMKYIPPSINAME